MSEPSKPTPATDAARASASAEEQLKRLLYGPAKPGPPHPRAQADRAPQSERTRPTGPAARSPPAGGEEQLKKLLFGREKERLDALESRLDDPEFQARLVSQVLPRAVFRRSQEDSQLAWALRPTLESSIRESVRQSPHLFADALFPVMGPAIRRSISNALSQMLQRLNEALSRSLSLRSLRWRLEAARTGRPFAEVALLRTLAYRVEQVFLVHRESGLLLEHVTQPDLAPLDPGLVSGMLTAIREFGGQAFHEPSGVESLRIGELSVIVEAGPDVLVAAAVRGTEPQALRTTLAEAAERVHLELGDLLENFRGDARPFEVARPILEACLTSATLPHAARRGGARWIALAVAIAALAAAAAATVHAVRARAAFERTVAALEAEPGLTVIEARPEGGRYRVVGLRDPLAAEPAEALTRRGLDPGRLAGSWTPFVSLEAPLVERRAVNALQPPPTVSLDVEGGTLKISGQAPPTWARQALRLAPLVPGVERVSTEDLEVARALRRVRERIPCPWEGPGRCYRELVQ